ncbi:MAG: class I SAM-dependent methyltransferase [Candidatus Brocadiales bacterium]
MDTNPEWWKTLFDDVYLVTDARSVCDDELTRREVDFLEAYLRPEKEDEILDLCGGEGRHSLEMARRGYKRLTVLDYSDFLVGRGRVRTQRTGYNIHYLRGDARQVGLKGSKFRYVILMANSFGYCLNEEENASVLREARRLLDAGGGILLDLCDPDYVTRNFRPYSRHEANEDIVVTRERELNHNKIITRESVSSKKKGLIREGTYCETIYSEDKIKNILAGVGFKNVEVRRNFSSHTEAGDYGFMTNRMIVTGNKVSTSDD